MKLSNVGFDPTMAAVKNNRAKTRRDENGWT